MKESEYLKVLESIEDTKKHQISMLDDVRVKLLKLIPLLPEGWKAEYLHYGHLFIMKSASDADALEFREVCRHIDRIWGLKLKRGYSNDLGALMAIATRYDTYSICVYGYGFKCQLITEEKFVPAHTEVIKKVPPECLGI